MEIKAFFVLLLFLTFINSKQSEYNQILRNLWEEDMEYETAGRDDDDIDSLEYCAHSDYKYFSFIQSGNPATFDHYFNDYYSVSINY